MNKIAQIIIVGLFFFFSCQENKLEKMIVQEADLQMFFKANNTGIINQIKDDITFWEARFEKDERQYPYLLKIAANYSELFEISGNDQYLLKEGTLLNQILEEYQLQEAGLFRRLAQNAMNRHAFEEAIEFALQAKKLKEKEYITDLLLFDLHSELGNAQLANKFLDTYPRKNTFAYLVRKSKALDGEGDLIRAIDYMDRAAKAAKDSKDSISLAWTFNMLGDYHGHWGKFQKAYHYFQRALQINPLDAFATQKIISILINVDQNYPLAQQMLNRLKQSNQSPLLLALEAELEKAKGYPERSKQLMKDFVMSAEQAPFQDMYRTYLFYAYNDDLNNPEKALSLALEEIHQRPTPESYDLQMWSLLNQDRLQEAQAIAGTFVIDQSEEPIVLYHLYQLHKAMGDHKKANLYKEKLSKADLELGRPIMIELFDTI